MEIGNVEVAKAFVAARGEMAATVTKDARANYGKYATLAAVMDAISPALSKHKLAAVQEAVYDGDGIVTVDTWLLHESGATIQFAPLVVPVVKRDAQGIGSAITYGRRYQMMAVCGLAPDDDDGAAAVQPDNRQQVQRQKSSQNARQAPAQENIPATPPQRQQPAENQAEQDSPFDDEEPNDDDKLSAEHIHGMFHAEVGNTFGGLDIDVARHWLVKGWTKQHTDNERESSEDLTGDEKLEIIASLKANRSKTRANFTAWLAKQPKPNGKQQPATEPA